MKLPVNSLSVAALLLAAAPAFAAPKPCETVAQVAQSTVVIPETVNGVASQVQLNATPSKNAGTYSWTQLSPGPYAVALSDPSAAKPIFTVPAVGPEGATLRFRLTVTGCPDLQTSTAETTVTVTNVNSPPVASAIVVPTEVYEGTEVHLDGSTSSDPENDPLTYSWEQTAGPAVTLGTSSSNPAVATFLAPTVPYPNGASLTFKLTVSDGTLLNSTSKTVTVMWLNDPPVAIVDCPEEVEEGGTVTMTSTSTDSDDGIASYHWTQLQGIPNAELPDYDPLLDYLISFKAPLLYSPYDTMKFQLTVTDNGGLFSSTECDIKVRDITAPVIAALENMILEASSAAGAAGTFSAAATDNVDGAVEVSCDHPSGSTFPLGKTLVTCSAADKAGNAAKAEFTVTVQDTTAPAVMAPADVTLEAAGPLTTVAIGTASATDAVGVVSLVNDAPAGFGVGSTRITWTAKDAAGNVGTAVQTVTVRDTTPPVLSGMPDSMKTLATSPAGAVATFTLPSATDLVDGPVNVDCSAASGSTFPIGKTQVTCSAVDAHGNVATSSFEVAVVYNWAGFFSPIEVNEVNKVKAGSAIPIKFSLGGNMGLDLFSRGYPISTVVTSFQGVVSVNDITDLGILSSGGSGLSYDPLANQYVYVWKTDKAWAGTSRQLQVRLKDGMLYVANFSFVK